MAKYNNVEFETCDGYYEFQINFLCEEYDRKSTIDLIKRELDCNLYVLADPILGPHEGNSIVFKLVYSDEDWSRYLSRKDTLDQLRNNNFLDGLLGDPTIDIGTTFKLAKNYNITLCEGLGYSNVKAYLSSVHWNNVPEDIHKSMVGWCDRFTVQAAVCHCLLNCREQGLL